jgi:hypothetical protein
MVCTTSPIRDQVDREDFAGRLRRTALLCQCQIRTAVRISPGRALKQGGVKS